MNKVAISVIIPIYNAESFLHKTIESVLLQTFTDFELLALDDGSTDRSAEIIKSYDDPRIHYILCPHDFVGTLNHGLSIAQGKYIAQIDHDDLMVAHRLQTQYDFMESHPDIVACGGYMKAFGKYSNDWQAPVEYAQIMLEFIRKPIPSIFNTTGFIRRKSIETYQIRYKHGYSFAADLKFWSDIFKTGKVMNIPKTLVLYRTSDTQTSLVTLAESRKAAEIIYQELIYFLLSKLKDNEAIKCREQFMPVMEKMIDLSFFSSNIYFNFMSEIIKGLYDNGFLNLDEPFAT
jgi:glycosyltransferase involved in cell wall biosynthesis